MRKTISILVLVASIVLMLAASPSMGTLRVNSQAAPQLDKELNVYNWADYLDKDLLKEYEDTYKVKITYDNFASNEEMLTKIQSGAAVYDVIFPSDYMVAQMIELKLLAQIDKKNLTGLANIDPANLNPWYDPDNKYCVPYQWGITGIAYLSTLEKPPTSWAAIFDPEQAKYYKEHGGFNLLDDQREVIGAALKYLGYSLNDTDPKHVQEARDVIIKVLPFLHSINSSDYQDTLLIPREVSLSHAWSGDAAKAAMATEKDDPKKGTWKFVMPKEGGVRFQDNICVTATSKRKATAEHFMNYLLDAKAAARSSNLTGYPSVNKKAQEFTKPQIVSFIPAEDVLKKLEWLQPLDDAASKLYDETWAEIRAAQ
jgi:spermidine/putrescine-binding protein